MYLSREMKVGHSLLLGLNILVALSSISLLERMKPTVGTLLKENVSSTEAIEGMLSSLTLPNAALTEKRDRFLSSLALARANINEKEEMTPIARIERLAEPALRGDPAAVNAVVTDLNELGLINRKVIRKADSRLRKLGTTGGWAMAILGFITFVLGLLILDRFSNRIWEPVQDIAEVMTAWKEGNRHRRYHLRSAAREIEHIGASLNALLDEAGDLRMLERRSRTEGADSCKEDRLLLIGLLESFNEPSFLISEKGALLTANSGGLKVLSQKNGHEVREQLVNALAGSATKVEAGLSIQTHPVEGTNYWLCRITG
ncbi:MAG: hypothetical protein NDJ90_11665 [Oligoflexia bacterium]|nr:hypothetical protein [Oligoflexia bacterium]